MIFQAINDFSHMIKIITLYRIQTRLTILNYARHRNQQKESGFLKFRCRFQNRLWHRCLIYEKGHCDTH
jgi:hypothetical protein